MFRLRVLSALVGIPLILAVTWLGGFPFMAVLLLLGALALGEFYQMGSIPAPARLPGIAVHTLLIGAAWFGGPPGLLTGLILFFLALNIYWVLTFPGNFQALLFLLWGKLYITVLLSCFLWLRQAPEGFLLVAALFAAVWASDTGAYLVGMTLGRHRLIPAVSPKKSVEGAVGGLLFAAAAMILLAPYLQLAIPRAALTGLLLSVTGQLGDLAESALKRHANIKDSGHFLPGHGGVLDRMDSLLFAAPLAWLLFVIL
jgi:phosphatidate cytidylyltransferase